MNDVPPFLIMLILNCYDTPRLSGFLSYLEHKKKTKLYFFTTYEQETKYISCMIHSHSNINSALSALYAQFYCPFQRWDMMVKLESVKHIQCSFVYKLFLKRGKFFFGNIF